MMKYVSMFLLLLFVAASCNATQPCSPEDEDETVIGPTPGPPPGPGGPGSPDHGAENSASDPGESDEDAFGYSRNEQGQVCACDLTEYQEGGCKTTKPRDCDPQIGWDVATGECADNLQYFSGKKDSEPPPSNPPPTQWHCFCETLCLYHSKGLGKTVQIPVTAQGKGNDEFGARYDCGKNWDTKASSVPCKPDLEVTMQFACDKF